MVGSVVAEHLATPRQNLIGSIAVNDHPVFPCGQVFESGIQFAIKVCLLIVQVALHRVHGSRRIALILGATLLDWLRVLQRDG